MYGGTRSEMLRLIKDANEYGATIGEVTDLSIDSFADVVKAIDLIQRKQNIAGTTAKEAMHTIEGAARATQAAWKNVITAIAGGGDLDKAFDGLIQGLFGDGSEGSGLLANIIPRLQQTMEGIGQFVSKASPYITKYIPQLFEAVLPPLLDAAVELAISLAKALPDIIKVIIDTIPKLMQIIANALKKEFPVIGAVFEGLSKVVEKLFGFITNNGKAVVRALEGVLAAFVAFKGISFFKQHTEDITNFISVAKNIAPNIKDAISSMESMGAASTGLTGGLGTLTGMVESLGTLIAGPAGIIAAIVAAVAVLGIAIYHLATEEEAINAVNASEEAYIEAKKRHEEAVMSAFDAEEKLIDAQKRLAELENEVGQRGEDLYNAYKTGAIGVSDMTDKQRELMHAYEDTKRAEEENTQRHLESIATLQEQNTQFFMGQALQIIENGGNWNTYKDNVINAMNEGNISVEQARDLLGGAMAQMSADAQLTYLHDIPDSVKSGLNVQNYETDWQTFKNRWVAIGHAVTGDWGKSMDDLRNESETGGTDSGYNLTSGLQLGVNNGWSSAIELVISFGKNVISSLQKALDEASPSKAARKMGVFLLQGFGLGVEDEEDNIIKQVSGFGSNVLDALNDEIGKVNDMEFFANANVVAQTSGLFEKNKESYGTTYNFYQTNNSPKSLSTIEIYRQTRNQFSQLKGAMI